MTSSAITFKHNSALWLYLYVERDYGLGPWRVHRVMVDLNSVVLFFRSATHCNWFIKERVQIDRNVQMDQIENLTL
ncbi:hypothetical protein Lal_00030897 [Lupinus albus]|nr:hypothetical protein Lal_00030897 [Lupinus albus]